MLPFCLVISEGESTPLANTYPLATLIIALECLLS